MNQRSTRWWWFGMLAATVILTVAVVAIVRQHEPLPSAGSSTADDLTRPASLLIIGDSFVGGTGDPSVRLYWQIVAEHFGWIPRIDAVGGSGYANASLRPPMISRLHHDSQAFVPDVVLVDAGRNDLGLPASRVAPKVRQYLPALRRIYPKAVIAVMVPSYLSADIPPNLTGIRRAIEASAKSIAAHVIDPVSAGWYRGINLKPLFGPDSVHPGEYGNQYYARQVISTFTNMNIAGLVRAERESR